MGSNSFEILENELVLYKMYSLMDRRLLVAQIGHSKYVYKRFIRVFNCVQ